LRLGDLTSKFRKPLVGALLLSLSGVVGLSGCNSKDQYGPEDALGKSFLNPGEMMRLGHGTLQLPILDKLSGLDEPSEEFNTARPVAAADLKVDSQDYVIGKNDLLSVSLTDVTPGVETVKTARVSESGNISLPLIGQVPAAGFTEAQLERAIAQKYKDAGIVKEANVSVTVVEARQRTFQIRGAVARPGQYAIVQTDFRLLDALVLAGDVTVPQIDYAYVIRPPAKPAGPATQPSSQPAPAPAAPPVNPGVLEPQPKVEKGLTPAEKTETATPPAAPKTETPGTLEDQTKGEKPMPVFVNGNQAVPQDATATTPAATTPAASGTTSAAAQQNFEFNAPLPEDQSTIIKVPLRQLLNGDLKYNVVIRPQDTITVPVPEAGEFYMGGHVQRVGVYSLTGRQITLKQAVISAGMLDEVAIPERTEIIRRIGRDREVFVRVNLVKVFEGRQPDVFLKPYDIVQVGTNAAAPFLAAVRNGFRITYGFGFLYDRNYYLSPSEKATGHTTTSK
jgi:polysaccharide export outer membrane protein